MNLLTLQKYWTHILLAALLVAGGLYLHSLHATIAAQKLEIVNHKAQNKILADKLETQNNAIATMKAQADARVEAGKVAVERAKKEAETFKQRATSLEKAQPKFPDNICASVEALINEELKK